MITFDEKKRLFILNTENTTYVVGIAKYEHLLHLYHGERLERIGEQEDFLQSPPLSLGSTTNYEDDPAFSLNHVPLEAPTYGKGDYREPMLHIEDEDGYRSMDFIYERHEIVEDLVFETLPQAPKDKTLRIVLKEKTNGLRLHLHYTPFFAEDVLVRNAVVVNDTDETFILDRALSANVDFLTAEYDLLTLDGAWIRERHIHRHPLRYGVHKIDSKKGVSSSDHNPFFALLEKDAGQDFGGVHGFNLIYSGNFEANIEVNPHDMLRVNLGINGFDFKWWLAPQERFVTPEAVLTYSRGGLNGMRQNMHRFIERHVVKDDRERPVKLNNWEATYFDFNEKKILAIAKAAKKLGIECFCLDDGWFGRRDDDTTSLGEWVEHPKKLPGGLPRLSHKIKRLGLQFGLWVEPEMVNPKSDLYRRHPDWVIRHPDIAPSLGRNQLMLDLSKDVVVDHLSKTLIDLFERADVDYVKWDMNRNVSDLYSQGRPRSEQGKLAHAYVLGLYTVLERVKRALPDVLFESCASGGNRFDLGMLHYMPQTWSSDNTDAHARLAIQQGTSLPYPLSSTANHVSDDVSHQVLRHTPLESRFNVACFGVLGYELDIRKRPRFDRCVMKEQIAFYKANRALFQRGTFYDLSEEEDRRFLVVDDAKRRAALGLFQGLNPPNPGHQTIRLSGLDPDKTYRIRNRRQYENIKRFGRLTQHAMPIRLKPHGALFNWLSNRFRFEVERFETVQSGAELMRRGLVLPARFCGTGYDASMRVLPDFSSRLYVIEETDHESRI